MKQAHSAAMRIVLAGLALLAIAGCSSAAPCATCPKMEGRYAMTYEALSSESPDCAVVPPPAGPPVIEITRAGAEIRATLLGAGARGTLQDTFDFSLTGVEEPDGGTDGGSQQVVTMRGYFIPPVPRSDGGEPAMINGRWITHTERGPKVCEAERPATGIKQ